MYRDHYAVLVHISLEMNGKVESSYSFRNYRHSVNTLRLRQYLISRGVPEANAWIFAEKWTRLCSWWQETFSAMHGTPTMEKFVPNTRCVTCCPFPSFIHRAENTTVAYSGEDASLSSFIRLLLDQLPPSVSNPRRLRTNHMSQLLLFLNGHGGDHFFKFQVNDHQTLIP